MADRRRAGRRVRDLETGNLYLPKGASMKFLKRLKEPSTLAGLSALALLFGLPPGTVDAIAQIVGGAAALAAVFLPEGRSDA